MPDMNVDLSNPDTYLSSIPHAYFAELRQHAPVSKQRGADGTEFWAVTSYAEVVRVLKSPQTYSSFRGGVLFADPPPEFLGKLRENMLNRDPPDHTAMRRLANAAFSPKRVAQLEARISAHAGVLVDRIESDKPIDFANEVAGEMPLFVICEILGVPLTDRARLFAWTERMLGTRLADPREAMADGMRAAEEMREYAAALGRIKREAPADDLASDLLHAKLDGRSLTDGEFQAFFMLLFNAGSDTTRSLLCFGLDALLNQAGSVDWLRDDLSRLPAAIEEMLRLESPVIQFRRTANCDAELGGVKVLEGDKVVVFFPSANRDEKVFDHADDLRLDRNPNPHVAFGLGAHYCLGAPLARMESRHLFTEILRRFKRIERVQPLVPTRTNFIRGARNFSLVFTK